MPPTTAHEKLFCFLAVAACLCGFTIPVQTAVAQGTAFTSQGQLQNDGGPAMSGENYVLTGGFWSFISVVQTPGAAILTIAHSGAGVVISRPNTGNHTLQQSSNLGMPAAWAASLFTVTTNSPNGTNSIIISPPSGNLYFRLSKP